MDFKAKIEEMKMFYNYFLNFIDDNERSEENFNELSHILNNHDFSSDKYELQNFLKLIKKVSHNHIRTTFFYDKIFKVLAILSDIMKRIYSNFTIFNIFKSDKRILLFLIENEILVIDSKIIDILEQDKYQRQFYTNYLSISDDDNITQKKHQGVNDNYICELIRNDSIQEFTQYINKNDISIKELKIKLSIYETNSFLLKKTPNLIEYAAFYGSIKIFNYLHHNNYDLSPNLWNYAIHSRKIELIHLLEELKVEKSKTCFEESIKCHHNEIALYFENNDERGDLLSLKYHNYEFIPTEFSKDNASELLITAIQSEFYYLAEHIIMHAEFDVNKTIEQPYKHKKHHIHHTYYLHHNIEENEDDDWAKWNTIPKAERERNKIDDLYDVRNNFKFEDVSALHIAIKKENINIIELLLKKENIDVNLYYVRYNSSTVEYMTPLHLAIEKGNDNIVRLLLQHENINIDLLAELDGGFVHERKTHIHYAIEMDNYIIVDYLCEHYRQNINQPSVFWRHDYAEYEEKSPLVFAIEKQNYIICEFILNNPHINVNIENCELYKTEDLYHVYARRGTALHFAILSLNEDIITLLLRNRKVNVNALYIKEYIYYDIERRKQIKTPLYMAQEYAFEWLLYYFPPFENGLNLLNIGGGASLLENNEFIQSNFDFGTITDTDKNFFNFWDSRLSEIVNIYGIEKVTNDREFEYKIICNINQNQN